MKAVISNILRNNKIDEMFKMHRKIVDFHVHPLTREVSEKKILKEMEKANVDLAVLLALDVDSKFLDDKTRRMEILEKLLNLYVWNGNQALNDMKRILETAKTSNKLVANLVRKYPEKFVGFGSVNPSRKLEYVREKLKEIEKLDLKGIKLIPTLQFFNPKEEKRKLNEIFEFCEKKDKILIFHTGCDPSAWEYPELSKNANPKLLEGYIKRFKNVQVVLAHMGSYSAKFPGIWFEEAVRLGKKYANVWFDISAVTYLTCEEKFAGVISKEIGWNHVLFGSDFPVSRDCDVSSAVYEVESSDFLSETEKARVLGLNAVRLLGL